MRFERENNFQFYDTMKSYAEYSQMCVPGEPHENRNSKRFQET